MSAGVDVASWLASVAPEDLLPTRRRDEAQRIERPLTLVGSAWLDEAHGYAIVRDARSVTYGIPLAVGAGGLRRAVPGDGTSAALVAQARDAGDVAPEPGISGTFALVVPRRGTNGGGEGRAPGLTDADEAGIDADQTNDLVVVGAGADRVVVKWDLHPGSGDQVGPARLAALARAGFAGTPRTVALVGIDVDGERHHVATIVEYVPDALDGWDWTVDEVRALALDGSSRADESVVAVARIVAGMHVALASGPAARASEADVASWVADADRIVEDAELDDDQRAAVTASLAPLARAAGTLVAPIHGDLHVGQILRAGEPTRFLVIDFDGSPTDTPAQRREPQPVARDVASMLASWDHVGRVVLHRTQGLDSAHRERVLAWIERSQRAFLETYAAELAAAGRADLLDRRLVRPYQVLQECREYAYARRYLPHWRYVPDAALPALLARPEGSAA